MNPFIQLLKERRSIRRYENKPVPEELIELMLESGIWSPSAHNRQPWRFATLTTFASKEKLALAMGAKLRHDLEADHVPEEVIKKDVGHSYERITQAPLLILLCVSMVDMDNYPDPLRQQNEWVMAVQSTAMAGQNLLLAAHTLGLGACWMCAPLFCPEVVKTTLKLPNDWQPQALITAGYPAQTKQKKRHPTHTRTLRL